MRTYAKRLGNLAKEGKSVIVVAFVNGKWANAECVSAMIGGAA